MTRLAEGQSPQVSLSERTKGLVGLWVGNNSSVISPICESGHSSK